MQPLQHIKLSFKCPKQLNQLQACNGDWYCNGCNKIVRDFREMTDQQIVDILANSDHRICGIFQTDRTEVLPQQGKWLKWAFISILAASSSLLQSCKNSIFDLPPTHNATPVRPVNYVTGIPLPPKLMYNVGSNNVFQEYLNNTVHITRNYHGTAKLSITLNENNLVKAAKVISGKHYYLNRKIVNALLASSSWIVINGQKHFIVDIDLDQLH